MSDYISREAAIEDFEQCNRKNPTWTPQRVKTLLMRIQTADVEPVRPLAEVVEDPRTYPGESRANYGCTACRRILGTWKKGLTFEQLPNFCCWCGAEFTDGWVKSEL